MTEIGELDPVVDTQASPQYVVPSLFGGVGVTLSKILSELERGAVPGGNGCQRQGGLEPSMEVLHTCDPSAWETEAGGFQF